MSDLLFNLFRSDIRDLDAITQKSLFSSFRSLVYRSVFFILNDRSLAEDAVQEALIKAMKHGPKTRLDSNMKSWLRHVARNAAYDILRKNKKYRHVSDIDTVIQYEENDIPIAPVAASTEQLVETMIQKESLIYVLHQLHHEERILLILRYIEGLSYKEIAQETGIPERILGKRLERAKKRLGNLFLRNGGEVNEA